MQKSNLKKQKQVVIVPAFILLLAGAGASFRNNHPGKNELAQFIQSNHVPYSALTPLHLPTGAELKTDQSSFDSSTGMLTLRWVFPAQTLPGQGTVLLYQHEAPKSVQVDLPQIKDGKPVEFNTVYGKSEGNLGTLMRGDIPDSPGQRALRTIIHDRNILIVSYAISDDELLKIAESLK